MSLTGKRVLIVEDDDFIASSLADEVTTSGGKVVETAGTFDRALDIIATTEMDGATVDIMLMGQRTFLIADALVARHIPFIFATGLSRRDAPTRHVNIPWLEKPFLLGAVCRELERAMCMTAGKQMAPAIKAKRVGDQ